METGCSPDRQFKRRWW